MARFRAGFLECGKIDQCDQSYIVTKMLHLNYLPLVPVESVLVLREGVHAPEVVSLGWNVRSIFAGYVRVYGTVLTLLLGFLTRDWMLTSTLAVITGFGWLLGILSPQAKAKRRVYSLVANASVDLALTGHLRPMLLGEAARRLQDLRPELAQISGDRREPTVVLDYDLAESNLSYLCLAFCAARLQWSLERGSERTRQAGIHKALWERISALNAADASIGATTT